MTESTNVENAAPEDNTQVETVEPTLDDLYKESGLEVNTSVAQPQTQAAPQYEPPKPQAPEVPDPFDVDNHKAYLANLAQELAATKQSHAAIQQAIAQERQQQVVAKLEEEIKQASEFVAKESGIDNPNLATFELNERARTDPKFKALWEGRDSSPQARAAFTKALGVVSREIGKKYEIKTDPQLVANRKALAASRQSSATTVQEESDGPDWGSKNGREFQMNWDQLVRPNN